MPPEGKTKPPPTMAGPPEHPGDRSTKNHGNSLPVPAFDARRTPPPAHDTPRQHKIRPAIRPIYPCHYFQTPRPAPKPPSKPQRDSFTEVMRIATREHSLPPLFEEKETNADPQQPSFARAESVAAQNIIPKRSNAFRVPSTSTRAQDRSVAKRSTSYKVRRVLERKLTQEQHDEDMKRCKEKVAKGTKEVVKAYGKSVRLSSFVEEFGEVGPYRET